jgi:hypothetical protein
MTNWNGIPMTLGQSLRPYPYFQNLSNTGAYDGSTIYHSMLVKVEKRFQNGSEVTGSYAWSKVIGNTDTGTGYLEAHSGGSTGEVGYPQDFDNPKSDRSLLGFNTPQRAVISYVLNLPFGKGQKYISRVNGAADKVVSGWAVNGITSFQSGNPLGFFDNNGNSLTLLLGAGQLRPNVVPGCKQAAFGSRWQKYLNSVNSGGTTGFFNTACFTVPPDFSFGNAPRNDGSVISQGVDNFDFSVLKSTKIREKIDVQFRAEFFNLFNHPQFAAPGVGIGAAFYNRVSIDANDPRLGQFALRVNF